MKKLFLIVAAMFAVIPFLACSDDEDNGGGSHASMVSQIIEQDEDGRTWIWNFDYDNQGRVTKIAFDDGYTMEFSYSGNKVTIIEDGDLFFQATLNEQGYIATLNVDPNGCIHHYSYDKDGYVSKIICRDAYPDNDYDCDGNDDVQCIWNNGDLIKEYGTGNNSINHNYEYTDYPAKQNIDIHAFTRGYDHAYVPSFIGAVGLVGRKNAHLIKSANLHYGYEWWVFEENISYDYELDDHGNPTKVVSESSDRGTATYTILYR